MRLDGEFGEIEGCLSMWVLKRILKFDEQLKKQQPWESVGDRIRCFFSLVSSH